MNELPKIVLEIPTDGIVERVAEQAKLRLSEAIRDSLRHADGTAGLRDVINAIVRGAFNNLLSDPSFKDEVRVALRNGILDAVREKARANVHLSKEQLLLFAKGLES